MAGNAKPSLSVGRRSAVWIAAVVLWMGIFALVAAFWPVAPVADRGVNLAPSTVVANEDTSAPVKPAVAAVPQEPREFTDARLDMVSRQLRGRNIVDERVLAAMATVPRHLFVPTSLRFAAYDDRALPIGHKQTISQPYIVALMTQLARTTPDSRVLEIGTGSGYQAAVLARICRQVYSIEIVVPLAQTAEKRLTDLECTNVVLRQSDGYQGWAEAAPFDAIIVTAAPEAVPQPLIDQLAVGGRMVIPLGRHFQELAVLEKLVDGSVRRTDVAPVMFVPMTGAAEEKMANE